MGALGQCVRKARAASPLARVQSRQNLMMPEPRSLSLFTKKPPRNVPPPPAGTTRYPTPKPPGSGSPSPQMETALGGGGGSAESQQGEVSGDAGHRAGP
uniref:Uncharacterized protein n=1 Tax=Catagonus wagneri TaxID=51154 RepID=A0A8C3VV37_9CETA